MYKFSNNNDYAIEIIDVKETSYTMKRYDFSLGSTKRIDENNIKRLLFSVSIDEIFSQLDNIASILKKRNIRHNDINPGNLLFSERDLKLKLIDFYWASTDHINNDDIKGINGIYKKDAEAFSTIKKQISAVNKDLLLEVSKSKKILRNLGKTHYPGSAKHVGKTYHPIPIHYYKDIPYHKDIDYEFNNIINSITEPVESMIDIGCAAGNYIYTLSRRYNMNKVIGYEADPIMRSFLEKSKEMFVLDEFKINPDIDKNTEFEKVDLVICMNVHMWLVKEMGRKADNVIAKLIKNSKQMFFQTAHAESAGIYKVDYLKSKGDIVDYLKKLGAEKVTYIDKSKRGGLRFLFKVE